MILAYRPTTIWQVFWSTLVTTLLSLLIPQSAFAQNASDAINQSSVKLMDELGVSIPLELGCEILLDQPYKFPLACFSDNINIMIDDLTTDDEIIWPRIERYGDTGGWREISSDDLDGTFLVGLDWLVEPQAILNYFESRKATLCIFGRPDLQSQSDLSAVLSVVQCQVAFDIEVGEPKERRLQFTFIDYGQYSFLADKKERSRNDLYSFVGYFVSQSYAPLRASLP